VKIYTRRGDHGETDLFGGGRVSKDTLRVAAYGEVDELNAALGAAVAASAHVDVGEIVRRIQGTLFDIGAYLATPDPDHRRKAGVPCPGDEDVARLEAEIDRFEKELAPLKSFVLPGGTPAAAAFHLARTVCRRAERSLVALDRSESQEGASGLDAVVLRYTNRLSDLLFVLARLENRRAGVADIEWVGRNR